MGFEVTRRDVMKFAGGAAIGVALSPAPWKLLDDLAIWTQNGSWIPRVPRGPVTAKTSLCALCPAGCPIRARCVADVPVQLTAASGAPLCPLGLTGHHLAWHPARLTSSVQQSGESGSRLAIDRIPPAVALATLGAALKSVRDTEGTVAVLDLRPGRSLSWAWRNALRGGRGAYVPNPDREGAGLALGASPSGGAVGVDLDAARTILSFGAPIAEGWGSPRNATRILEEGRVLVQAEPVRSRTAAMASRWLPVRPDTEAIVAMAIGRALVELLGECDGRLSGLAPVFGGVDPATAARAAGIETTAIEHVAELMLSNAPAVAIAGEGLASPVAAAVTALNALLDAAGMGGCVVEHAALPEPFEAELAPVTELDQLPDRSVSLLVIDASAGDAAVAWPAVRAKLRENATTVALTPFLSGTARHAGLVLASPVFLESIFELPTAVDARRATWGLSAPLRAPGDGSIDPAAVARLLAESSGNEPDGVWENSEDLLRARVARIHEWNRGAVVMPEGAEMPVTEIGSAGDLWEALLSGGLWTDDDSSTAAPRWDVSSGRLAEDLALASVLPASPAPLTLVVGGPRDVTASAVASPVMTKLYQESKLRREAGVVVMHPDTAREQGAREGRAATLVTEAGRLRVKIVTDVSMRPGLAASPIAPTASSLGLSGTPEPEVVDICTAGRNGGRRATAARLEV